MTPRIYPYKPHNIPGLPAYRYLVVFHEDEELGVTYPAGPFCFFLESDSEFDDDRLSYVLIGLRWDPEEFLVIYGDVELHQVDPPESLTL